MEGATLASSNIDSELDLNVAASSDVNAKNITCRIESVFGTQSRQITVTVVRTPTGLSLAAVIGGTIGGFVLLLVILAFLIILCCFLCGARYVNISICSASCFHVGDWHHKQLGHMILKSEVAMHRKLHGTYKYSLSMTICIFSHDNNNTYYISNIAS